MRKTVNVKKTCILLVFILILNFLLSVDERNTVGKGMEKSSDFEWDQAVIYFLLTDRFNNGDKSNDDPNGENYDKKHLESYHGGDFQGIIDKLDYLQELGINTIWITPIVDNIDWNLRHDKDSQYAYHGYWAKDFTKIDEHLGDVDIFKELLDQAHERNIKVMVDVVLNHAGYGMKEGDMQAVSNYPRDEEREVFKGMLRLNPQGKDLVKGELAGLPDFITEDLKVRQQIIDWQKNWIENTKTQKGNTIDYFRVDTAKHVEVEMLKDFKDQVRDIDPDFRMIAEYYDGDIFANGSVLDKGGMDGVLDFSFKDIAKSYTKGNFEEAEKKLLARNKAITEDKTAGQFLSSHDENGFLALALGGDTNLFKLASSLQLTAKGQPVIYYGEEIGMSGKSAGDMDKGEFGENRYDFDWSKVEGNDMLDHYKKLLKIRSDYFLLLARGDRNSLVSDKKIGISTFSRSYEDQTLLVALNNKDKEGTIRIASDLPKDSKLLDLYSEVAYKISDDGSFDIRVPASSKGATAILKFESPVDISKFDINILEAQETEDGQVKEENNIGQKEINGEGHSWKTAMLYVIGAAVCLYLLYYLFIRSR